ncbi:GIY-YIG nuclease family protein [Sphingomonas aerolata]|uniref:GIY-YIG nuclease family protein n=1 Tax=Sphingomonas aerolata TaxID=185951 RepID=UPI002FE1C959
MSFYAYMLRCSDGSYYIGHTDALEPRIAQHQCGELPGYTHNRRPVTLMWSQDFPSRSEALEAERQLKGWTRAKKEALAAGDWDAVRLLARKSFDTGLRLRSAPTQDERGGAGERTEFQGQDKTGGLGDVTDDSMIDAGIDPGRADPEARTDRPVEHGVITPPPS